MSTTSATPLSTLLETQLHPIVASAGVPAVVAALVRGDDEELLAIGQRQRGHPDPVDTGTVFQTGSITKTFTGLLLAEMAVRGEVAYTDPIDAYLPEPDRSRPARHNGPPITLIDLATHSGGLPRLPRNFYPKAATRWRSDPYAGYRRDDLYRAIARIRPAAARTPPRPHYSTFGIGLLGELLAIAADTPYGDLLAERVIDPLGMRHTSAPAPAEHGAVNRLASGHRRGRPVRAWRFDALAGAGAVQSSAADMVRYLRAHLEPEAVPGPLGQALAAAPRPRHPWAGTAGAKGTSVALAWNHRTVRGHSLLWHSGATGGFTAFVGFSPTAKAGVAMLANHTQTRRQPVVRAARRLFGAVVFSGR